MSKLFRVFYSIICIFIMFSSQHAFAQYAVDSCDYYPSGDCECYDYPYYYCVYYPSGVYIEIGGFPSFTYWGGGHDHGHWQGNQHGGGPGPAPGRAPAAHPAVSGHMGGGHAGGGHGGGGQHHK